MTFGIIGTSIWQQNLPLLERLTIERENRTARLEQLKSALGVSELIYVATCNRVELLYAVDSHEQPGSRLLHRLIDFFFRDSRQIAFFPNDFYHFTGREAITHLFRTVSSLESLVVGETQITGQFKQAWQESAEAGLSGPALDSLAQEALQVAKRVKRETDLGTGALSMASLAAEQLYGKLGSREKATIVLVGSGAMTIKLAKQIRQWPNAEMVFVNRTPGKAEKLAEEFGGRALALAAFHERPVESDAIVSATASSDPVFDGSFADRLPDSEHRVICIDLAVPRDFDLACTGHPRLEVIDIPRLKSAAQGNLRKKFVEAGKANDIVRDAIQRYLSDRIETSLKPIFRDSYNESIEMANKALSELFAHRLTSLSDEERETVARTVRKLIGHSSFQSIKALSERLVALRSDLSFEHPTLGESKVAG
ncbi:glutamyl-tRNA reductase [bacterium]|nr:glutamyl-tRNA reductase [bacterium]